jgi:hypothetical protein
VVVEYIKLAQAVQVALEAEEAAEPMLAAVPLAL